MYDEDLNLRSAKELINFFLEENILAPEGYFDVSERLTNGYLFRGQADKNWKLLPTAHRDINVFKKYTPQPPGERPTKPGMDREYLALHLHAELRVVQLFLEAADNMGIGTPLDYTAIKLHQEILDGLKDGSLNSEAQPFPHQRFIPSMALAQHYGVPTRLLDWSASPLVAAYFAAEQALNKFGERDDEGMFSVICLGTQLLNKVRGVEYIRAPRAQNSFLQAQRGAFTLITNANQFFIEHGYWPSIEDVVGKERDPNTLYVRQPLIRLSLPVSEARDLLRLLYRLDISKLTVMPSLNNAAQYFAYKRELWPDP